jgi:DNA-binding CsgD family transcriptional regulator
MTDEFVDDGDARPAGVPLAVAGVLLLVSLGGAADLAFDAPASWLSAHVLFELVLMTASLTFAIYLWMGWRRASRSLESTRRTLLQDRATMQAEREQWRVGAQAALAGLGAAIDRQFDAWRLTPAEREVALLLLKGHGHKQIAGATNRSERTVRQHAVAVYQKSGLGGRAELAAFFLEDLLLPRA